MSSRIIWCLGMYASASTWAFNVAQQIHEQSGRGQLKTTFVNAKSDFKGIDTPGLTWIIKSHEIMDEPTALVLAARANKILVTMRDPRDAITSLILYHKYEFERALPLVEAASRLCMGYARDRRALLLHYESGFFEDPATPARLAAWADYPLPPAKAEAIFLANQRKEVEKYIAGMAKLPGIMQDKKTGDKLDPRTHWHSHHAGRTGEIGRWRHSLTPGQATEVERRLKDCYVFAA